MMTNAAIGDTDDLEDGEAGKRRVGNMLGSFPVLAKSYTLRTIVDSVLDGTYDPSEEEANMQ